MSVDELINAIRRLKNGKSADIDEEHAEIVKECGELRFSSLLKIFKKEWREGRVP